MKKQFGPWHNLKSKLNNNPCRSPYFYEREIWWCSVGLNIGVEIDGKRNNFIRPVLIFKKQGSESFLGVPATSQPKKARPYYFRYNIKGKNSNFSLGQIRLFDAHRLVRKMDTMPKTDFEKLKVQIKDFLS